MTRRWLAALSVLSLLMLSPILGRALAAAALQIPGVGKDVPGGLVHVDAYDYRPSATRDDATCFLVRGGRDVVDLCPSMFARGVVDLSSAKGALTIEWYNRTDSQMRSVQVPYTVPEGFRGDLSIGHPDPRFDQLLYVSGPVKPLGDSAVVLIGALQALAVVAVPATILLGGTVRAIRHSVVVSFLAWPPAILADGAVPHAGGPWPFLMAGLGLAYVLVAWSRPVPASDSPLAAG